MLTYPTFAMFRIRLPGSIFKVLVVALLMLAGMSAARPSKPVVHAPGLSSVSQTNGAGHPEHNKSMGLVTVNEESINLALTSEPPTLSLVLDSRSTRYLQARVTISLLEPSGRALIERQIYQPVMPGATTVKVPLPGLTLSTSDDDLKMLWRRVRYVVERVTGPRWEPVKGIVSLSQITPELFEIGIAAARFAIRGFSFAATAHAFHPITGIPQTGVAIDGLLTLEAGRVVLKSSGITDGQGYVHLRFDIPKKIELDEGTLRVTGRRAVLVSTLETNVAIPDSAGAYISTDKQIYQPGQTLHARFLALDMSHRPLAAAKATFTISNPENTVLMRTELTTSEFGIASADWVIPEGERLGDYELRVQIGDNEWAGEQQVKISRYDLPAFTVTVTPDEAYYLPGNNARVDVRADYTFGKPVTNGSIRVVAEESRTWNFRDQKWEIEEGEKVEGTTDSSGLFSARINLSKRHDDLARQRYDRFQDLAYSAYFTDASTGRTEQRRFRLRITRDPIHIYAVGLSRDQSPDLPLRYFVTTFYPDGRPEECDVEMSVSEREDAYSQSGPPARIVKTVKTNRYGVAFVDGPVLPKFKGGESSWAYINFRATDRQGLQARHSQGFRFSNSAGVQLDPAKTIHRPGEPLLIGVRSTESVPSAVIDVYEGWTLVDSKQVSLVAGAGSVTFQYQPAFSGVLTVTAYPGNLGGDESSTTCNVVYPAGDSLNLAAEVDRDEYRPGQEVEAILRTQPATRSALGIAVVDTAVEERARRGGEFGFASGLSSWVESFLGEDVAIAGVTRREIETTDTSIPIPEGLDLVAGALLADFGYGFDIHRVGWSDYSLRLLFGSELESALGPVKVALAETYSWNGEYPATLDGLKRILRTSGVDFDAIRDAWGVGFRAEFSIDRENQVLEIRSAGPDKQFGTRDDLTVARCTWPYFKPMGHAINAAVARFHARTGRFIRDAETLESELKAGGIDFQSVSDPWGRRYRIIPEVDGSKFVLKIISGGPDGRFASTGVDTDDITVWSSSIDYFAETGTKIDSALQARAKSGGRIPDSPAAFQDLLESARIAAADLLDPWGRPYYTTFAQLYQFSDRVVVEDRAVYPGKPVHHTEVTPVTQRVEQIALRSAGEDTIQGTADDFKVGLFSAVIAEYPPAAAAGRALSAGGSPSGPSGSIFGFVVDPNGASVGNANVEATTTKSAETYQTKSSFDGSYLLSNMPAGVYTVRFDAVGFKSAVFEQVVVKASCDTRIDAALQAGGVAETVTVSGEAPVNETTTSQLSTVSKKRDAETAPVARQIATPPLRRHFTETAYWVPELDTDSTGEARVKFKLADNITTWKMSVIASTKDGRVAMVDKRIRAFQPFFVDHDPPKVLTVGDEVFLPVVIRNYLGESQAVTVAMSPESWFGPKSPRVVSLNVAAGGFARATFGFRAVKAVADGAQRVTAAGRTQVDAEKNVLAPSDGSPANHVAKGKPEGRVARSRLSNSDAIEKRVTVNPDGRRVVHTASRILDETASLDFRIPSDALPGTNTAALKIYPNLMTHVIDSVEAILRRPYGCAEQTISSVYPGLLILTLVAGNPENPPPVAEKARRYLQAGYDRLLNYQEKDGGFSYWGHGNPDVTLTAYALRFLTEAQPFIAVDESVIADARRWVESKQDKNGSWPVYSWDRQIDGAKTVSTTAYIATVLSRVAAGRRQGNENSPQAKPGSNALRGTLDYLSAKIEETDEPYANAAYALAAFDAREPDRANPAVARLVSLAREEGDASYWALETNTPFFGWGLPGRIEASALAVRALARAAEIGAQRESSPGRGAGVTGVAGDLSRGPAPNIERIRGLINSGIIFLLRHKDAYGVWYSTQATIDVLDTLVTELQVERRQAVAKMAEPAPAHPETSTSDYIEVYVNGKKSGTAALAVASFYDNAVTIELGSSLRQGDNHIEIRRFGARSRATAHLVASSYQPWIDFPDSMTKAGPNRVLKLSVQFDKARARVGEEITCTVEAERIGFRGYGMLVGEIGLPPGAEVDRESLDKALAANNGVDQYDILPDRLLVYLWPQAGGTKFQFKFRPRFGMNALTQPSLLYDYYNPEAEAFQPPARFIVASN
jgi:hypothetical protein